MEYKVTTENHRGKATIFKSSFLESLTKTSLTQNIIVYGLLLILLIYNAIVIQKVPVIQFVGIFFFALFFWTLAEYLLHRYLFHWISENKFIQRFHFIMHGSHHLYPRDSERLLMPPVPGILMASILFLIFYLIFSLLNIAVYTWAFFPGFFLGYLLYSFLHRATHVMKPPKRFKYLWKHHSLHHYKYPNKAFGVSNTFWDHIFGTMPPKNSYK
jgi:sterol desaturase/sphingolipid hydroxylase (fatty acid hydroxylase superfamily)